MHKFDLEIAGRPVTFEVNSFAKQSSGSVLIRSAGTVVLVTANVSDTAREGVDFLPLTMEYVERTQAAGKIPGGFFKREGRPSEKAILTSRIMDRPIRPLIADGFFNEIQVICTVFSADNDVDPDTLALTGASCALCASEVPLSKPVGCVRVGRIDGQFVVNPSFEDLRKSDLDLIVASTEEAIVMVEGGANELAEQDMLDALMFGFESAQPYVKAQQQMMAAIKPHKLEPTDTAISDDLVSKVESRAKEGMAAALAIAEKQARSRALKQLHTEVQDELISGGSVTEDEQALIGEVFDNFKKRAIRDMLAKTGKRVDGRGLNDIREISGVVGLLPKTHGSAIFTRGETSAMVVATLGTGDDEQRIDALEGEYFKRFMLHYNFPPYCVGETRFLRSPGRREIGHGALAERSLIRMIPAREEFPYTIRIVSDILESNGSSSMATVCGASLALMDAGVPIRQAVAGIAMGLVQEDGQFHVLSDILGDEDHIGDMDFKVAGTTQGITGLQMDIKISGVSREILAQALEQARAGRMHILAEMEKTIAKPRDEINENAPRIHTLQINPEKIKDVIGPGGKVIRGIIADTGVKIDISDDGKVLIASADAQQMQKAIDIVESICEEAEVGKTYKGTVKRVVDFGAFVEILPGTEGLVHISQLDSERVEQVRDVVSEGDEIEVKVIEIGADNKIRLSRRAVITGEDISELVRPMRSGRSGGRRGSGPRRR